jgi:hypothetical protein
MLKAFVRDESDVAAACVAVLLNCCCHPATLQAHITVAFFKILAFFPMARQPLGGLGRLIFRGFTITLFGHTTLGRTPLDE